MLFLDMNENASGPQCNKPLYSRSIGLTTILENMDSSHGMPYDWTSQLLAGGSRIRS